MKSLESAWGSYLLAKGGAENAREAISHFVEAGETLKATEAAIGVADYKKACFLLDDDETGSKSSKAACYAKLAKHFERLGEFENAERCFVTANDPAGAVEMHGTCCVFPKSDRTVEARLL